MNKAIITKYKAEFDWWLNDGQLLVRSETSYNKWMKTVKHYAWSDSNADIIIDDKYVELRKAHADGKTIQLNDGSKYCPIWNKVYLTQTPIETYPVELYRIKPEPDFNIGDWITTVARRDGETLRVLAQVTGSDSCKIVKGIPFNSYTSSLGFAEAWKPERNEWCIFWNDDDEQSYHISQFHIIAKSSIRPDEYKDMQSNYFTNIAPLEFAQTLKDY